jgi:CBS domain-containing protein
MLKAKDIMTKQVITVNPDTSIDEFAGLLIKHNISGAPIVDEKGHVIGIVTENDLIRKKSRLHIPTIMRLFDAFIPLGTSRLEEEIKRLAASTVDDICTANVITIDTDATIEDIATIMSEKNIHLLPVLHKGKLTGIIGKRDLIKGIAGEGAA